MVGNPLGVDWYMTIVDVTYEIIDRDVKALGADVSKDDEHGEPSRIEQQPLDGA